MAVTGISHQVVATPSASELRMTHWAPFFCSYLPRRPSPARVLVAAETPKKPPGAKNRGPTLMQTSSGPLGVRPLLKDT